MYDKEIKQQQGSLRQRNHLPFPIEEKQQEFEFSEKDFERVRQLIASSTRIVLRPEKKTMVYSRLARRLRELGFQKFQEYCHFIESPEGHDELIYFTNALTTNLTRFFREDHHFSYLKNTVVPELTKRHQNDHQVRIWSAGCSSGEEPYSISMTLIDSSLNTQTWDTKILATDVDTQMVQTGKAGVYSKVSDIPSHFLDRFCTSTPQGTKMKDEVKKLISFKPLNLFDSWPMQKSFDVIFCRNVVIYFDKPTQRELFKRFSQALSPKGWLFIGHSENLYKVCDDFELIGQTIYQKKF